MLGDGRNQVVSDTIIDTGWGNAIADRTCQSYDSIADRDAQWVTPQPGAMCYTSDDDEFWIMVGGKWKLLPTGYIGSTGGPAAYLKAGNTLTTVVQVNFTAKNNRVYHVVARGACTQRVKGGSGYARFYLSDSYGNQWYDNMNDPLVGDVMATSGSYYLRATSSGAAWARLSAMSSISGGYVDFGANGCRIYVEDVGG